MHVVLIIYTSTYLPQMFYRDSADPRDGSPGQERGRGGDCRGEAVGAWGGKELG